MVFNWTKLAPADRDWLKPKLLSSVKWILLALSTGAQVPQIPPLPGALQLLITSGKACRKEQWWKSGDDHLLAYDKEIVM